VSQEGEGLPLSGKGALLGAGSLTGLLSLTLPLGAGTVALALLVAVGSGEVVADDNDDDSEADEVPENGAGAGVATVHGVTGDVGGVPYGRECEDVVHGT